MDSEPLLSGIILAVANFAPLYALGSIGLLILVTYLVGAFVTIPLAAHWCVDEKDKSSRWQETVTASFKAFSQNTDWRSFIQKETVKALSKLSWQASSTAEIIHLAAAKRDKKLLLERWQDTKKILLADVASKDSFARGNANGYRVKTVKSWEARGGYARWGK